MRSTAFLALLGSALSGLSAAITFHKDFEGGSFGRIEQVSSNHFRVHVQGQSDQRGRNRQATWYFFRTDAARGTELTISLTNLVGEYNDRPGAVSMNAETIPVFSHDGEHWQHFRAMAWDNVAREATLRIRLERDSVWIAHVPPYDVSRLQRLLNELKRSPYVRFETIGRTVEDRELPLVTVTDLQNSATPKKTIWLIARQHAWEAGTSFVMEGAMNFVSSSDSRAQELRERITFKFVPMMAQDGVIHGKVRFNMNGYDLNRHWDDADWKAEAFRHHMPEIWSVKRALYAWLDSGQHIDLMVNLHNTETGEFLRTQSDDREVQRRFEMLEGNLLVHSGFNPSTKFTASDERIDDTNSLWRQRTVPVALMEQRISFSKKLGRQPTSQDRLQFGRDLVIAMADVVLGGN
jgi:hypothetical protein